MVQSGNAREGAELEPKSKTELLGLGFGQRNVGEFILGQSKPYWGGLHCV